MEETPADRSDALADPPSDAMIDVPVADFIPMDKLDGPAIDVPLTNFTQFDKPDVLLSEFQIFDTPPVHVPAGKSAFREWIESLAFTIIFVLVFTNYVAQATQVPTESMKPTIMVGDHFFLDKLAFPANFPASVRPYLPQRTIRRGDIIAFKSPTDETIPFVKRVIGTPGDTVEIHSKNVFVNNKMLDEPYKIHVDPAVYHDDQWTPEELKIRDNYGPITVPPNSFFCMGDNRDNSNDSRFWGFVTRDAIIGKPLFVYWSYESDPWVPGDKTLEEWVQSYSSIAMHFFSRTRWFRIGTMVE